MDAFWASIVTFFQNLGKTAIADIIAALPEVQQTILAAFQALLNAAIAYVVNKYGEASTPEALKALSPEAKLALDNQRHNEAFNYIKSEVAKNPSAYPAIPDSLLHTGIEIYYQKYLRSTEGNHGVFPGGNSGPVA